MQNARDFETGAAPPLTLKPVRTAEDVLPAYRDTPIADLFATHNLGEDSIVSDVASMVIVTCMDARLLLRIPERGAFVLRTAGAAPEPAVSNIAFAVAVAGLRTIAIIGHTDCAMSKTDVARGPFVSHLIEQERWSEDRSRAIFDELQQQFAIRDPVEATYRRGLWLAERFPSCLVAPLLYRVEDHALVQIVEAD